MPGDGESEKTYTTELTVRVIVEHHRPSTSGPVNLIHKKLDHPNIVSVDIVNTEKLDY